MSSKTIIILNCISASFWGGLIVTGTTGTTGIGVWTAFILTLLIIVFEASRPDTDV